MDGPKKRVAMKATSEAMRAWSQALRLELESWPGVTLKSAFGMTLVYRRGVVFAALPGTRALYAEDALLLKFPTEPPSLAERIAADRRFAPGAMQSASARSRKGESRKWRIFLMRDAADLHPAIEWLLEAHRSAVKGKN